MPDNDTKPPKRWIFRLYVAGSSPNSQTAVRNLKSLCRDQLKDNASVEIIDLYERPELAREFQIIAAPTLEKLAPPPYRRLLGDLSNTAKVFAALEVTDDDDGETTD